LRLASWTSFGGPSSAPVCQRVSSCSPSRLFASSPTFIRFLAASLATASTAPTSLTWLTVLHAHTEDDHQRHRRAARDASFLHDRDDVLKGQRGDGAEDCFGWGLLLPNNVPPGSDSDSCARDRGKFGAKVSSHQTKTILLTIFRIIE